MAGLGGDVSREPARMAAGFGFALRVAAALCVGGALVALGFIRRPGESRAPATAPCCPLDGPPLKMR
jgi:hypothetical protein